MFLSIVIPAYNEEKRLEKTVKNCVRFLEDRYRGAYEIIIVDDGSRDGTLALAERLKRAYAHSTVISYGTNRGKGYAVKKGMLSAEGDVRFFMDADGSTPIDELPKFLQAFESGADIVIGSRHVDGSRIAVGQPLFRKLFGRLANVIIKMLLLPGISDSQCGFKGFTARAAKNLFSEQTVDGWGFDFEILARARAHGFRIAEVPVTWLDSKGSRVRPIRGALHTLGELIEVKYRLERGRK